jgi:hypothetical protein
VNGILRARHSWRYYVLIGAIILLETPGLGSSACNDMFGR